MNLLGMSIKHKVFGVGKVTAQDETHVTIEFPAKTSTFQYPTAFENFLTAEDSDVQALILNEIQIAKDAAEAAKRAKLEAEEAARHAAIAEAASKRSGSAAKPYVKKVRGEGQRLTYLVFQGGTFDEEYKGQFIWAPKFTKAGDTCHHWDRLMDVREGDIILHAADGYIKAVSIAKGSSEDCVRPVINAANNTEWEQWEKDGRRVNLDYTLIKNPIKHGAYKESILEYCKVKYAPFDKDGNGNMGYLFDIDETLASIFLTASAKQNKELYDIEYLAGLIVK